MDSCGISLNNKQIKQLNAVDLEYMKSQTSLKVTPELAEHIVQGSELKSSIYHKVNRGNKTFADGKYRNTEWSVIKEISANEYFLLKDVTYDKIKFKWHIHVDAGVPYRERWHVVFKDNDVFLKNIVMIGA